MTHGTEARHELAEVDLSALTDIDQVDSRLTATNLHFKDTSTHKRSTRRYTVV